MKNMKKFLLPFLLALSFLQIRAQTPTEISNILNTKVTQITTTNVTALNNDAFSLDLSTIAYRMASVDLTGAWTATLTFQGSNDNFTTITSISAYSQATGGLVSTITTNGHYVLTFTGFRYVRLRATAFTSGPAVSIAYGYLNNTDVPFIPILPIGASTEATLSTLNGKIPSNLTVSSTRLLTDGSGVTQPVSLASAITANIGTTNGLALDATLTGGTQQTKITDGTNLATVKAASTAAGATDKALVVAISPNNSVAVTGTFFQGTQPVNGTVTANIGTTNGLALDATLAKLTIAQGNALGSNTQVMVGGSVTTAAPTYTTGQVSPFSLTTAGLLRVDGSGVTQPVSGGVTANAGTNLNTSALAVETGGNLATVKTNTDNLALAQASTTSGQKGNLIMGAVTTGAPTYTTAQTSPISLTTAGEVRVINSNTQTISGTVTANAGTNLNTSLLALETGGNLATVKTNTDNLNNAQGSTTSGQKGLLMLTATTTAAPTYTTAQSNPLSTTTAGALRVDASATTQPISGAVTVSGSVTSNIGTTNGLALDATLTGGTARTKVTDGTNNAGVKAASTAAVATDPALVVTVSPNTALPTGTNYIGYVGGDLTTTTTNRTTAGNGNNFAVSGMRGGAGMNITGSAVSFVFKAQVSMDGGTTWSDSYLVTVTGQVLLTATINGQYGIYMTAGVTHVRVVLNSITSGTFTYQYTATQTGNNINLSQTNIGFAVPPDVTLMAGSDGSNAQALATTAKGTQGANGLSVQDMHDAGRTHIMLSANGIASGTTGTETAITLVKSSGTSATSSAVSFVVTSGKRFRITSITVASRGNATATAQITTFNFRINTGGAVTTASTPIVFAISTATPATASAWDRFQLPIPDGYEILGDGTLQFGITANSVFVTNAPTWFVNITGYEY